MKKLYILSLALLVTGIVTLSFSTVPVQVKHAAAAQKDSVGSVKAFMQVYKVLMSPRCMNCHPDGDVPLQGDDSHLDTMNVQRGLDGRGVYGMRCSNCHQPDNIAGLHMPPGNPNWGMPSSYMKMVFQGRTP